MSSQMFRMFGLLEIFDKLNKTLYVLIHCKLKQALMVFHQHGGE